MLGSKAPLGPDDKLDLTRISPALVMALRGFLGRLVPDCLDERGKRELVAIIDALDRQKVKPGLMMASGEFAEFPAPVTRIRIIPFNPKRK